MSQSRSGKPEPVLEGVELLFHQKGGLAKMALSLNGVDSGCMNSITGSIVEQSAQISYMISESNKTMWWNIISSTSTSKMLENLILHYDA